jgi:hypothetical protein
MPITGMVVAFVIKGILVFDMTVSSVERFPELIAPGHL